MGIQINGNTNNINAGIGSLSIEDINELDIVGVATAANFKTGVSNLHSVGLSLSGGQIDVGSNIKIGNAGVITATSFSGSGANLTGIDATALKDPGGDVIIQAQDSGAVFTGIHTFSTSGATLDSGGIKVSTGATISPIGNASFTGIVTASSFIGDGSSLSNLPAGAPVGGASTNTVFFENDIAVAVNYQITSNKNAMSAGPISINAGIAVTVPSGCSWTIV